MELKNDFGEYVDNRKAGDSPLQQIQIILLRMLRIIDSVCAQSEITYWLDGGTLLGAVRHQGFIPWDDDIDIVMPREDYERFLQIAPHILPEDLVLQTRIGDNWGTFAVPCRIRDRHSRVKGIDNNRLDSLGVFLDIIPLDKYRKTGWGRRSDEIWKRIYRTLCGLHQPGVMQGNSPKARANNWIRKIGGFPGSAHALIFYRRLLEFKIRRNTILEKDYFVGYSFDTYWHRLFELRDLLPTTPIRFEGYEFPAPRNADSVLRVFYGDYKKVPEPSERKASHMELLELDIRDL